LDGFPHQKVKVISFLSDNKANTTGNLRPAAATVVFDKEDFLPNAPMEINTKKSLTSTNENCEIKDGIRGQLPKLDSVGEQEAPKEFVCSER
jgi:hypothetical protein